MSHELSIPHAAPAPDSFRATTEALRRRAARWLVRASFGRGSEPSTQRLPTAGIHRILVCHISHTLGNTLLLTPLLRELQCAYPGAEIDVMSRSPVADEVFKAFPSVHRVYRVPRHGLAAPWRLVGILKALRRRRYDLAIDPCLISQSDRMSALLAQARYTLGYAALGKYGGLSHAVAAPAQTLHVGKRAVYLLRQALGRDEGGDYPPLDICLTPRERADGATQLHGLLPDTVLAQAPSIALFCNATGAKHLGAAWWMRFAAGVQARWPQARIVEIVALGGASMLGDRYPSYYSSDLRRLASVVAAASVFVSADCGVMHLACAAGARTVGLFAVTDPAEWGPYTEGSAVVDIAQLTPEQAATALPALDASAGRPRHDDVRIVRATASASAQPPPTAGS